jgi:hypothetical protein
MLSPAVPIARCPWLIAAEDDTPLHNRIVFLVLVVAVGVVLVGIVVIVNQIVALVFVSLLFTSGGGYSCCSNQFAQLLPKFDVLG